MRYSSDPPQTPEAPVAEQASNEEFFDRILSEHPPRAFEAALLLVGARDHRALAVRRAQAALRYDRRPSEWSHAALLLSRGKDVSSSIGLEVALDSDTPHDPERNGVTVFALSRYLDTTRYPNLCLVLPSFSAEAAKLGGAHAIVEAALDPNRERARFPLYDGLAAWAQYAYSPDSSANPLISNVPLPAAAYCEYAYAAAGVDLTPGATSNSTCPELIWATLRRWSSRLSSVNGTTLHAYAVRRDHHGTPLESAPPLRDEPLIRAALGATGRGGSKKRRSSKRGGRR